MSNNRVGDPHIEDWVPFMHENRVTQRTTNINDLQVSTRYAYTYLHGINIVHGKSAWKNHIFARMLYSLKHTM